jgi:mono/diheme cytochrome c family protein
MNTKRTAWIETTISGLILLSLALVLMACQAVTVPGRLPASTSTLFPTTSRPIIPPPTPTLDRLSEPPLPPNPTQLEQGRYLYWLNCMACHGDKGQGLTDEFRSLYVEDQNCWGRGCHAGHMGDQGFPIPRTVPAIISSTGDLPPFATADQLFEFLRTTHPPQHPGILPDDQYWAISAYLLAENGRLPEGEMLGPEK